MNRTVETGDEPPPPKRPWGFRQWLRVALGATMLFLAALSLYRFITGQGLRGDPNATTADRGESMGFDSLPEFARRLEEQGKFEDARQIYVMLCRQSPNDRELWSRCLALNEREFLRNLQYGEHQRNIQLSGEVLDLLDILAKPAWTGLPTASIEEWTERRRQSAVRWIEGAVQLRQSAERAARLASRATRGVSPGSSGSVESTDPLQRVAEEARIRLAPQVRDEVVADLETARRRKAWAIAAERWLLLRYLEPGHPWVLGEQSVGVETLSQALQVEGRRAPRARIREFTRVLRELDPDHPVLQP